MGDRKTIIGGVSKASLVLLASFLIWPYQAFGEDCSKALDPALKSFMENTDAAGASSAFGRWVETSEGHSWAKNNVQNGSLSFLGDFKLDLGFNSSSGGKDTSYRNGKDLTQQSFSSQELSVLRQEITTTDQWKAYQTCILSKFPNGRLVYGALEQIDASDWRPVTLKIASNRTSEAIPVAIVTSMAVYGADSGYENWRGKKVSEEMTQILMRQPGRALAVTISTTLGSYIESLPAVTETSAVEVHSPYCEPCALMPAPPNGVFCLGRFSQYWGTKLASHGLSQEDGEGLPVRLRTERLAAQCRAVALSGTLGSPPPGALPNESAVNYQQRIGQLRQALQGQLQQSQQEVSMLEGQLKNQGDRWFQAESYSSPDPIVFCQHNPYMCQWNPMPPIPFGNPFLPPTLGRTF